MVKMNLTNVGIVLGAVAAFYVIAKAVKIRAAIDSMASTDGNNQYAAAWSDNYDWVQSLKNSNKFTYV